jgi:dihydroorotate dehydrogenase (NAD+) catalytic subunit
MVPSKERMCERDADVMAESSMSIEPIYDPHRSYEENFEQGPFGLFADGEVFEQNEVPAGRFLGLPVHLPFGVPAGPLLNSKFVNAALDAGFDLPVYKTVRTRRYASHAWPNVLPVDHEGDLPADSRRLTTRTHYSEPLSITNSFGVPSFEPAFWQADIAACVAHARTGQAVIASFQGTKPENGGYADYIADFALGARLLRETGVQAVEVNLSCPNEGTSNLLCFDAKTSGEVMQAVRNELGDDIRLLAKISYFADDARLRGLLATIGSVVDGISAINTIAADVVDGEGRQALPGEGRLRSGVCGRAIRWAGLEMTQRLAQLRDDLRQRFAIVGVGGVCCVEDYRAFRAAGADAVMAATAMMWNPLLAQQIKASLAEEAAMGEQVLEAAL